MYRVDEFEQLIRSDLSDEKVVEKILSVLLHDKKEFYYDNNNLGYHIGFIDENTYIPITRGYINDAVLKVDETDIYLQAVREIRNRLIKHNNYKIEAILTIQSLINKYFYEDKGNAETIKLVNEYSTKRINYLKTKKLSEKECYSKAIPWTRNQVIFEIGYEENFNIVVNLRSLKGLADGAQCVERNALSHNLLVFFGFPSMNISSKILINGTIGYHNYNIYQLLDNQNYIIFDAAQNIYLLEIPKDCDLEAGFTVHTDNGRNIQYIFDGIKTKTRKK